MPPATSHRAWALARLAQIREVADERRRWADLQQRQLQPADVIDAAQVAQEAEAARLEDVRLQARQQRHAATLAAAADTRARARAKRQAQAAAAAQAAAVVEVPVAPSTPRPERHWDRRKQRWVKRAP